MNRFMSNSAKDVAWRVNQMHANNAIEGVSEDKQLSAEVARWDASGMSDEDQIARLVTMAKQSALEAA